MQPDEARARLAGLGFAAGDVETLFAHFDDAERRGKLGHGHARIEWLATQALRPDAVPERRPADGALTRWESHGAVGYLVLAAIVRDLLERPPRPVRVVVADAFPSGHLGYWVRQLAEAGLVVVLTATSPARLAHPAGGEPVVGTNPLAIALPGTDAAQPIVVDVSMAKATYGDVVAGRARSEDVVPFGGEQAHKAFALALGFQGLVEAFVGERYGIVLVVAQPTDAAVGERLRARAAGLRLPGDA
ncbi:MAG TPA: Ldh family oxidoreductase [Gaiellaceae bacterium]|nr:Ldh family oxidoreductase [Gaiellaceae bacterium]